jgi:hypothetical protein
MERNLNSCATIPVDTLAMVAHALVRQTQSVYNLMVCTLNICSSSTSVAAIPFCITSGLPINYYVEVCINYFGPLCKFHSFITLQ